MSAFYHGDTDPGTHILVPNGSASAARQGMWSTGKKERLVKTPCPQCLRGEICDFGKTLEKVVTWLDKVLAENDNGPLMIGYHLKVGYSR